MSHGKGVKIARKFCDMQKEGGPREENLNYLREKSPFMGTEKGGGRVKLIKFTEKKKSVKAKP